MTALADATAPIRFTPPPVEPRSAGPLLDRLHGKIAEQLELAQETVLWRTLAAPETDARTAGCIIKYVMLESFSFTPHAVRSIMYAIARFPHTHHNLCRLGMHTILEEVSHSELALRDFVALGGDEEWARSRRLTGESLVISAVMHMLSQHESPFAYLGQMYLFENMTRELAPRAKVILESKGVGKPVRKFIDVHAVDDIEHSIELAQLIDKVIAAFPAEADAIEYGMDVMRKVYPVPLWDQVMRHVHAELSGEQVGQWGRG